MMRAASKQTIRVGMLRFPHSMSLPQTLCINCMPEVRRWQKMATAEAFGFSPPLALATTSDNSAPPTTPTEPYMQEDYRMRNATGVCHDCGVCSSGLFFSASYNRDSSLIARFAVYGQCARATLDVGSRTEAP